MADEGPLGMADIEMLTSRVQAELATARGSGDARLVQEALINAMTDLVACVRGLASELAKVEIEGLDPAALGLPRV